jgi:SEC-C motif
MTGQIEGVLGALIKRYNAISTEIDRSVNRLEVDGTVTYRPLFLAGNGKPTHNSVRTWVRRLDPAHGPGVAQTRASRVSSTPIPMRGARSPNQDKGENDPCPCGSGRKYKRCCAALDLSTLINRGMLAWSHRKIPPLHQLERGESRLAIRGNLEGSVRSRGRTGPEHGS